jgi:hypothetical protein
MAIRTTSNAARAADAGLGSRRSAEPPPLYAFDADIGRLAITTPRYSTAIVPVNQGAFDYGGLELARLVDRDTQIAGSLGGVRSGAFGVRVTRGARMLAETQRGRLGAPPRRAPLQLTASPRGAVRRAKRFPAFPDAGPFRVLRARGRTQGRGVTVTTDHRFDARSITTTWSVHRAGARGPLTVEVRFPTSGAHGGPADGTPGTVQSGTVLDLRSPPTRYRVALEKVPAGATLLTVRPGRSKGNPRPGRTAVVRFTLPAGQRRAVVRARVLP